MIIATWSHIMIHHSLTDDGKTVSWSAIRRYHEDVNGWRDIGYHAGVELINDDFEALIGRGWDQEGAHCKEGSMNRKALGICLVGNFDKALPPEGMMEVARDRVINPWMHAFGIKPERIVFHREYATYKSCPGTMFTFEYLNSFIPGVRVAT